MGLAELPDVVATGIDHHIRVLQSANLLCLPEVELQSFHPAAGAAGEESIVAMGNTHAVVSGEVAAHIEVHPHLDAALLKVAGEVPLLVYPEQCHRHGCLVVNGAVGLHDMFAPGLQQFHRVFEQPLEAVVLHIEMVGADAVLVAALGSPRRKGQQEVVGHRVRGEQQVGDVELVVRVVEKIA